MCKLNKGNGGRFIDPCMQGLISRMTEMLSEDFKTVSSCCGHEKYPMTIVLRNKHFGNISEFFTGTPIMRTKKFYKKDKQDYYYIPEIIERSSKKKMIKLL